MCGHVSALMVHNDAACILCFSLALTVQALLTNLFVILPIAGRGAQSRN